MYKESTIRQSRLTKLAFAGLTLMLAIPAAIGQVSGYGDKQMGEPATDQLPNILHHVAITQKLNSQIPLNGQFRDESGNSIRMGDYFGKRPVILALVYYKCPMLCSEELDGLVGALEMVKFVPGKDFDVVVVSIDASIEIFAGHELHHFRSE